MTYDIGKMTRELQDRFRLFKRDHRDELPGDGKNLATPTNVKALVVALEELTEKILEQRADGVPLRPDFAELDPDFATWDADMSKWQDRLSDYYDAVDAAAPDDRAAILWSVTAPLLIGFYGGEEAKTPQQPLDAMTPFSLANQLELAKAWKDERWNLLLQEIKEKLQQLGIDVGLIIAAAAGVALGVSALFAHIQNRGRR